ncbi:MAG: hypothetical protein QOJ40_3110 [Verrucomicrobiota bacterium]
MIGLIVLLLGIGSAGLVYWRGTRAASLADDASMAGFGKADRRQMEILYGQMGVMTQDLLDDLKHPGTQAVIIVAMAALVASGCFYFAPPKNATIQADKEDYGPTLERKRYAPDSKPGE